MKHLTSVTMPVVSFRNLETPHQRNGYRNYFAIVATKDLPDLSEWRRINVRDPKTKGSVPAAIRTGFLDNPELFLFMNRGLVLSVDSVSFDQKASTVTIYLGDPNLHGLLDGGHTYKIVGEVEPDDDKTRYVKIEILEGLQADNLTAVVDARNTSNQVADESLMNLAGDFNDLKKALQTAPYYNKIAFKEFEYDATGEPKPIDVREIIAILTAFDRENFNERTHPINAYRSKAACVKHFKENLKAFEKIYPLAQELLHLFDQIQLKLPELYNTARGQTGDVTGGKFGRLTGVAVYRGKRQADLNYLGVQSKYGVPAGFVYPVLGAFRALLEKKNGQYVWGKGLDPIKLLEGDLGLKLADTIGNFALDAQNPSKTGKSPLVWQACYQSVEVAYLRTK
jgi:AIPR protein